MSFDLIELSKMFTEQANRGIVIGEGATAGLAKLCGLLGRNGTISLDEINAVRDAVLATVTPVEPHDGVVVSLINQRFDQAVSDARQVP